jgi:hypothetical protein
MRILTLLLVLLLTSCSKQTSSISSEPTSKETLWAAAHPEFLQHELATFKTYMHSDAATAEKALLAWIEYVRSYKPEPTNGFEPDSILCEPYFQLSLLRQNAGDSVGAEQFLTQSIDCQLHLRMNSGGNTNSFNRKDFIWFMMNVQSKKQVQWRKEP